VEREEVEAMNNRDLDNYITGHYGEDDPANKDDQEDDYDYFADAEFFEREAEKLLDEVSRLAHIGVRAWRVRELASWLAEFAERIKT